jgi:hypothetical protein
MALLHGSLSGCDQLAAARPGSKVATIRPGPTPAESRTPQSSLVKALVVFDRFRPTGDQGDAEAVFRIANISDRSLWILDNGEVIAGREAKVGDRWVSVPVEFCGTGTHLVELGPRQTREFSIRPPRIGQAMRASVWCHAKAYASGDELQVVSAAVSTIGVSRPAPTVSQFYPHLAAGSPCPVHAAPLREARVPIARGYIIREFSDKYRSARESEFPFANDYVWGGCDGFPGQPTQTTVLFCPECRKAQDQWMKTHDVRPDE